MKEKSSTKTENSDTIPESVKCETILEVDARKNTIFRRDVTIIGTPGDAIIASNMEPYEYLDIEDIVVFESIKEFYDWVDSLPQTPEYTTIKARWVKIFKL